VTTNKLHDTRTNIDDTEQHINNANNSLIQDNDFDNESAHTMPIDHPKKRKLRAVSGGRQIEAVQAEAEVAQKRYIDELARIAKIADTKRIQKLQMVELERQESMARLKKKTELKEHLEKKKKETMEAEAAIKQIEDYEEEQLKSVRDVQQ
jgi:hypothetical protein